MNEPDPAAATPFPIGSYRVVISKIALLILQAMHSDPQRSDLILASAEESVAESVSRIIGEATPLSTREATEIKRLMKSLDPSLKRGKRRDG